DDAELGELELSLAPGDVLVLYTDGVSEVRDEAGQLGEEGIAEAVARAAGGTATQIADAIEDAVRAKDDEPRDDIAILVVRVTG
ncbi:MAG TPA: SpoIIE family protein phosphatase, partial [Actinomycetota bacterium]|nr:SpoIIE family protein phosphatase [Actinomycetota bacterium]